MKATVGRLVAIFFFSVGALGGCSGGGGGGSSQTPLTGVFVDAPVENLAYRTATQSGRTDAEGSFTYLAGETVTFSIGAIDTPAVAGAAVLSPMAVFGAQDLASDEGAVNLARLLQSLDADLDPSNGISIGEAAHAAATSAVEFADPGFDDAVRGVVTVALGDPDATLVSSVAATAHLASSFPIVGAWAVDAGLNVLSLTFLADGTYVIAGGYGNTDTSAGQPGVEMGTYSWNPVTGEWTADVGALDTDGDWSFSNPGPNGERGTARGWVTIAGSELTLSSPDLAEAMVWTRVAGASALVGTWFAFSPDSPTRPVFLTLFPDGTYLHAEGLPDDEFGSPGIELGTYSWDGANALDLTGDPAHDTNGDWGFQDPLMSDPEHVWVDVSGNDMLMDGDGLTTTTGDRMSWRRIGVD